MLPSPNNNNDTTHPNILSPFLIDTTVEAIAGGNPNRSPVVFVSANGDIQIAMSVKGITCTQCVKMIETVLRGVDGPHPHIVGLLDAVGDKDLAAVLIKISTASYATRIAHEAANMLSIVGYEAIAKEMDISNVSDLRALTAAYDIVAVTDPMDVFDWTMKCSCPDDGVIRDDCERYDLTF